MAVVCTQAQLTSRMLIHRLEGAFFVFDEGAGRLFRPGSISSEIFCRDMRTFQYFRFCWKS